MSVRSSHKATAATDHHMQATTSWVDMMEAESPDMPPLFEGLLTQEGEGMGDEDTEGDPNSDLLEIDLEEKVADNSHLSLLNSLGPLAQSTQHLRRIITCTRCVNEPR